MMSNGCVEINAGDRVLCEVDGETVQGKLVRRYRIQEDATGKTHYVVAIPKLRRISHGRGKKPTLEREGIYHKTFDRSQLRPA